jgi:hypothetical protein
LVPFLIFGTCPLGIASFNFYRYPGPVKKGEFNFIRDLLPVTGSTEEQEGWSADDPIPYLPDKNRNRKIEDLISKGSCSKLKAI